MLKKPKIEKIYDPYLNNKKRKKVCIVMPTFNQYEETRKNIILLKKQTLVPDIIIVDNNSTDNTFEKLKNEFSDIILIKLNDNYGGAGGFYIGQKYAYEKGYEYIILNDNDAYPVDNDLIEKLVKECDETTVTQPFNIVEDHVNNYGIWFFHYCSCHRNIVKNIGFIDYKFFLYGDEVEYMLRILNKNFKIKKIFSKYIHPLKYHYSTNRTYFAIRNEFYLENVYKERRKSFGSMLLTRFLYFKFYEPTKLKVAKKAIMDLKNKIWNNEFIKENFPSDIVYFQLNKEEFLNKLSNKKVVYIPIPKIEKILQNYKNKKKYSKFSFLKNKILVTNSPTINMFLFDEVYYIVNFDEKKNKITYFKLKNNIFDKLKFFIYLVYYTIYLKLYLYLTKNSCYYFKKLNEDDLKCKDQKFNS